MPDAPSSRPSLAAIITTVRAGSLAHAWDMFMAGGYDQEVGSPASLAVKGRLLKARAARLPLAGRAAAFAEAADAYAAANRLLPQPYTMGNVATLQLLAGERDAALQTARALLAWLERGGEISETPFYLAATRAEALLICGDSAAARAAFAEAMAHDPDGWDDHAAALRQFALILQATGRDDGWLDGFRPPRSLHFAGHLGVAAQGSELLAARIAEALAVDRIGFGFGALAAGADIVIAEALLARGAELHVVLPTVTGAFIEQSVAPYGADWIERFAACLAAATSLRVMTQLTGGYEHLASELAADFAMGAAVINARKLESEAVQLLVIDDGDGPFGTGLGTARDAVRWADGGRRQTLLAWPRNAQVIASGRKAKRGGRIDRRLVAMLHLSFDGLDDLDEGAFADAVDTVLTPFRAEAERIALRPDLILPAGNARLVAFAKPDDAWRYARAILALSPSRLPLKIAGHYALAHWLDSPAALVGRGITELAGIAAAAIPGVLIASDTLACALNTVCAEELHAELVGEAGAITLFALSDAPQ